MPKQKYWDGTQWVEMGASANKVKIIDSESLIDATDVEGALEEIVTNVNVHLADNAKHNNNGQLTFPATQNPSSDPNILDDYEEGIWNMSITFGGNAVGQTYVAGFDTGKYVKIGSVVHVFGIIYLATKGSSTGIACFAGLPFACGSGNSSSAGVNISSNRITFADNITGDINPGDSKIILRQCTNAGVQSNLDDTNFANNSYMTIQASYPV